MGDLPRRPGRRRTGLEDAPRGGTRGGSRPRRCTPTTPTAGLLRLRRVGRSRGRQRTRRLCVLPAQRGARAGALGAERPARRERARRARQRPRARHRPCARRRPDRADASRGGRPPPGAGCLTRPRRHLDRASRGRDGRRSVGTACACRRRRPRRARLRPRDRRAPLVASRGRGRRRVPRTWTPSSWSSDVEAPTLDAATGRQRGETGRLALPGAWKSSFRARTAASAIVVAGKPRARAIDLASGARLGRVKHLRAVTDAAFAPAGDSLRAADATARGASGARDPGARLGCLSRGHGARCSVSRSTGSAPGSPPGVPIRPGVSGGHGQDGCSPRCSGTRAT